MGVYGVEGRGRGANHSFYGVEGRGRLAVHGFYGVEGHGRGAVGGFYGVGGMFGGAGSRFSGRKKPRRGLRWGCILRILGEREVASLKISQNLVQNLWLAPWLRDFLLDFCQILSVATTKHYASGSTGVTSPPSSPLPCLRPCWYCCSVLFMSCWMYWAVCSRAASGLTTSRAFRYWMT